MFFFIYVLYCYVILYIIWYYSTLYYQDLIALFFVAAALQLLRPENRLERSRDTPYTLEPIGREGHRDVTCMQIKRKVNGKWAVVSADITRRRARAWGRFLWFFPFLSGGTLRARDHEGVEKLTQRNFKKKRN